MIRYGREGCNHVWRYRKESWEDECIPAICVECGAFGCGCDFNHDDIPKEIFFGEGQRYDANVNDKWVNPYLEEK